MVVTMKTLVVNKDGELSINEVPKPKYNEKQALVKMLACGMCGTDIKLIHKSFKGFPDSVYPIMLGHEGVGEVVETGADVKGLKKGDKVLLPFVDADPAVYGELGSGWGAVSEYGVVHDPLAYPKGEAPDVAYAQTVLAEDLDPIDAVMFVTFREVLSSIRFFGVKPEDSIVVFGCGPVGQTFIKFLSLLGGKDIVAVDIVDDKLEIATENGATKVINSTKQDLTAEIRKIYPDGVKFVLDAVGLPLVTNKAMEILTDRGAVLCYGVLEKESITIDFSAASYNWSFICQQMPEKKEEFEAHEQVLQWVRDGKIVMRDYISDYFKFEDAVSAYDKLLDKKIIKKGIITF
ncbi:MAG: zinc-binding dehydrogenase [Oscillospiraceae bacterium]|nr:zinc-binding dehydrogenase [Oscillospiraceae bacterium]